jgi:hypothetical protein
MAERYECPESDCDRSFASLGGLKTHMARTHGGYTPEQIEQAVNGGVEYVADNQSASEIPVSVIEVSSSSDSTPPPPPPVQSVEEPKRVSRKSRELNDTLNMALQLAVKHLTKGLDDAERQQLDFARREITAACIGVEFDFEERLVTLKSKIWLFVSVAILYGVEKLPNMATMFEMLKKDHAKKPETKPEAPLAN